MQSAGDSLSGFSFRTVGFSYPCGSIIFSGLRCYSSCRSHETKYTSPSRSPPAIIWQLGRSPRVEKTTTLTRWRSSGLSTALRTRRSPGWVQGLRVIRTFPVMISVWSSSSYLIKAFFMSSTILKLSRLIWMKTSSGCSKPEASATPISAADSGILMRARFLSPYHAFSCNMCNKPENGGSVRQSLPDISPNSRADFREPTVSSPSSLNVFSIEELFFSALCLIFSRIVFILNASIA